MTLVLACVALAAPVAGVSSASAQVSPATSDVRLGWLDRVQWTAREVRPGVTVRSGVLADPSAKPHWAVTVNAVTTSSITGKPANTEVGTEAWARQTASALAALGYAPETTPVAWPRYSDSPRGLEGFRVRVGNFPTQAAANAAATTLKGQGFGTASTAWTGYDVDQAPDGELINVAVIDPRRAELKVAHPGIVGHAQVVTEAAGQLGADVVVDGGWGDPSGINYPGVPYSIGVYDGKIQSLGNLGRAALIIRNGRAQIDIVNATASVRAGGETYPVNGVNRVPGVIEGCGRPGAQPTERSVQDISCTVASELVVVKPELGVPAKSGNGTQAAIGADGRVQSVGAQTGGSVPAGGYLVQGIGAAAQWLTQHAVVGQRLTVNEKLTTASGRNIPLTPGLSVASAAPLLVKNGRTHIDAVGEGLVHPADLAFNHAWSEIRQPRTLAGIDWFGRLILVTVDGRQPGLAEGATLAESAALMKSLGAVDAMNLDGGGSTAMAVEGALVSKPSNAGNAQRANADFVVAIPKKR